jgi:hypothetical protein
MARESQKTDPPSDNLDEQTVVGKLDVIPSVKSFHKPYLLQQIKGPGAPRDHVLELDEIVVGRSHQAHISIDSGMLSRRHIALTRNGPEYTCSDLDSSNGMYLNGVKAHSAVLREGDTVQIGEVVFIYHEGS